MEDTWNTEILPELAPLEGETVIGKRSSIGDAAFRDYVYILSTDCTGQLARPGSDYSGHEASLRIIEMSFGWLSKSEDIVKAMGSATSKSRA